MGRQEKTKLGQPENFARCAALDRFLPPLILALLKKSLQLVPQRCKSIKGKFEERPNNGRQTSFLVLIALLRLNKFHETVFVRPDAFHRGELLVEQYSCFYALAFHIS